MTKTHSIIVCPMCKSIHVDKDEDTVYRSRGGELRTKNFAKVPHTAHLCGHCGYMIYVPIPSIGCNPSDGGGIVGGTRIAKWVPPLPQRFHLENTDVGRGDAVFFHITTHPMRLVLDVCVREKATDVTYYNRRVHPASLIKCTSNGSELAIAISNQTAPHFDIRVKDSPFAWEYYHTVSAYLQHIKNMQKQLAENRYVFDDVSNSVLFLRNGGIQYVSWNDAVYFRYYEKQLEDSDRVVGRYIIDCKNDHNSPYVLDIPLVGDVLSPHINHITRELQSRITTLTKEVHLL